MVSAASLFEITIKGKVGKMDLMASLNAVYQDIEASFIGILPITTSHLLEYQNIPLFADHRDPFDRVIVATAIVEKAKIITVDPKFQYYSDLVDMVW
jgi:PIN domain nuclease of toxin-antitoxin system